MVKIHHNECKDNPQPLSKLELKFVIDKGARTFLVGAVGPLNLKLAPQSRHSYISCVAMDDDENKENSKKIFCYLINVLESLEIRNGIAYCEMNNTVLAIDPYIINDLKMVGHVSDLNENGCFCPYCMCRKERRHFFDEKHTTRTLKYCIDQKVTIHTIICALHMKLRIVSNLISQVLLRINSPSLWEIIETRISKLYHCSQFQFRNTEAEEDDDSKGDQFLPQLPYLNGNQANVILFNFETVFDGIFDYMEIMIWLLTRVILFQYVEGVDTLKGNMQAKCRLEILCKWLGKLLREKYPASKFAFYFHILIVHIPELIFLFGPLWRYANEGSENIHAGHILGLERATAAGKENSPMVQLVFQELRRIYLSSTHNIPWQAKLVDDGSDDGMMFEWSSEEQIYTLLMKLEVAEERQIGSWKGMLYELMKASIKNIDTTNTSREETQEANIKSYLDHLQIIPQQHFFEPNPEK